MFNKLKQINIQSHGCNFKRYDAKNVQKTYPTYVIIPSGRDLDPIALFLFNFRGS